MPRPALKILLASVAATMLVAAAPAPTAPPAYTVSGSIAGSDGGWDYASLDSSARLLYVAHGNSVMVVDLAHDNAVRTIGMIAKAHAVVPIPGQPILLVTSGHDDSVRLLDTTDGHELAKIAVGSDPDAAFFDPASAHAVVMNAKGGTVSIIDVATRTVIRTITLKPGLEFGALADASTLYVNNEDLNEVETADLKTGKVGTAIPMPGCSGPTGLGYDDRTGMLISACANNKAVVIDARTRRVVKLLTIGSGPDAVIMDEADRLAIIPCGHDGTLSIVSLDAAGGPTVTATAKSEQGARTGAIDRTTNTLYLPTARFTPAVSPGARPVPVPGSFHVVVMTRAKIG